MTAEYLFKRNGMTYLKKQTLSLLSVALLCSCYGLGCGKKEQGTATTAQPSGSVKLEGDVPSIHKKSMADTEFERTKKLL